MVKLNVGLVLVILLAVGCQTQLPPPTGSDWIETQLFFGLTMPGGAKISDVEWHDFVDHTVTPAFPDGLTMVYGDGQYRGDDGVVHKEPSAVLILLHPPGADSKLNEVARAYAKRFGQESVLRADLPATTAFVSTSQAGATR